MHAISEAIGRGLDRLLSLLKWLVLPVGALLFLQWPLREFLHTYSREANDLGQVLFALYAAASISAASRAGTHLTAGGVADRFGPRTRRLFGLVCNAGALLPWIVFVVWTSRSMLAATLTAQERFQDTANPGYFLVKVALWLMAVALLAAIVAGPAAPAPSLARGLVPDSPTDVGAGRHP